MAAILNQSSCSEFVLKKNNLKQKALITNFSSEKQGRWTQDQNIKYLIFVSYNLQKFQCKKKRMYRLYKPLSKFILTRTSQQCRSHHRKLLQRFKATKNIIYHLENNFKKEILEQVKNVSLVKLQSINIPQKKENQKQNIKITQNKISQKNHQQISEHLQINDLDVEEIKQHINQEDNLNSHQFFNLNAFSSNQLSLLNYQAFNSINKYNISQTLNWFYFYNLIQNSYRSYGYC